MPTSRQQTKALTQADLAKALRHLHDAIRAEQKQHTKHILNHMNDGFARVNERFEDVNERLVELDTKVSALMESPPVTRREINGLISELRVNGMTIDERRIFPRHD